MYFTSFCRLRKCHAFPSKQAGKSDLCAKLSGILYIASICLCLSHKGKASTWQVLTAKDIPASLHELLTHFLGTYVFSQQTTEPLGGAKIHAYTCLCK